MKRALVLWTSCLLVGVLNEIARGELRTWTDRTGQQIEAELKLSREDTVWLRHQGKLIQIRIAQLSEADQRYVRDIRAGAKSPASAIGTAASEEGTTDDTAQIPETTTKLPQKPPAQDTGEAPAPTIIVRGEPRTWTARNGKYTIVAEFVTGSELSVTLSRDGKQRTIPLAALCDADQQFVRDPLKAAKPADTLSTATVAGENKGAGEANEPTRDWANLIDPSSFDKWTVIGAPDVFKLLPDATIRAAGGRAYLVSPQAYADFELTGRMKASARGNGGVFFGVPRGMNLDNPRGYEVQLYVRTPGDNSGTGSIWRDGQLTVPLAGRFEAPDRWYNFYIRCQGSSILIKINDQTVFEEADARGGSGHLALQCYETTGEVHYADLKVRELSKTEVTPPVVSVADGPAAAGTFSICGIKAGMAFHEIVPILKARGMRLHKPHQIASFLNNSHLNNGATQGLSYVADAVADRKDGQVLTELDIHFREDLPDRPGVGICDEVTFTKYYEGKGSPDLSPWFRQARNELVQRYGPPKDSDDDENSAKWRHHDSESLYVSLSGRKVTVCLESMDVYRRRAKGEKILVERFRPSAPEIKVDF
jgi:hypothetical protein